MGPGRGQTEAVKHAVKIPEQGAKPYAPSGVIGNSAGSGVNDDAVAKIDALEKKLDELQVILDSLAEQPTDGPK
jgi:hypothetical protein